MKTAKRAEFVNKIFVEKHFVCEEQNQCLSYRDKSLAKDIRSLF